jgi:hypothetical protein
MSNRELSAQKTGSQTVGLATRQRHGLLHKDDKAKLDDLGVDPSSDITVFTTATRPTPGPDAPKLISVKDAGAPEQLQVCVRRSDGAYEWIIFGIASF